MRLKMTKAFFGFLLFAGLARATDCDGSFTIDTSGQSVTFNNQTRACVNWQVSYFAAGFSAVSVQFESAPNGSTPNVPGTWVAFAGTIIGGINPNTAITQATTTFTGSFPWVRVRLVSATGTGKITGRMLGAQLTSATSFPSAYSFLANGNFYPPNPADFSWVNQGTATESTGTGGLYLAAPLNSATTTLAKRCATLPVAPWTATAAFMYPPTSLSLYTGIAVQQTGGANPTELLKLDPQGNPNTPRFIQTTKCSGTTVATCNVNTSNDTIGAGSYGAPIWVRVWDDGVANRAYEVATDGITWTPLHNYSVSRGGVTYAGIVPNQACWTMNQQNNEPLYQYKLVSWKICPAASTSQC